MPFLIVFVVAALLTGTLAACAALLLKRYAPAMSARWRRWLAPPIGAFAVMTPALAKAAHSGPKPLVAVVVIALALAVVGGIPAVRWFEGPRQP